MSKTVAQTREARAAQQAERRAAKRAEALAEATPCGCGCGSPAQRRYLPGHDARHKGQLLAAFDRGDELAEAELSLLEGFGYDEARLAERREADLADEAARQAKATAAKAKAAARDAAKAERLRAQQAKLAAQLAAHDAKVAALDREQAN